MDPDRAKDLLRTFEPILRFTQGERFFPMDVETYVRRASLWLKRPDLEPVCAVPRDQTTLTELADPRHRIGGATYYLRSTFPLGAKELATRKLQERRLGKPQPEFKAGTGRLARVGYTSRLVDAMFSLALLARGRVPGDLAAAAVIQYEQMMAEQEHHRYCGRVLQQNGWIVLQYWFFYLFNDWRSGFHGANDHEADWEMVAIYLDPGAGDEPNPRWVAYAAHDDDGGDVRRRWDDPELETVGTHPVVYVGAGSHASYPQPGEYLTEFEFPFLKPISSASVALRKFWFRKLRQYGDWYRAPQGDTRNDMFHIPFVDYARGDGRGIGPGFREWDEPLLLNPTPGWVSGYRGLWGYYSEDPFSVENAPSGPKFNRDGSVRRAWFDPTGWCDLDQVPPPSTALQVIESRITDIERTQAVREQAVLQKSESLQELYVELQASRAVPHLSAAALAYQARVASEQAELRELRSQIATDRSMLDALRTSAERVRAGELGAPREHLRRPRQPASPNQLRADRLAEFWAAISVGVMLLVFVSLLEWRSANLLPSVAGMAMVYVFIESSFRGKLTTLVSVVTVSLAALAAGVILYEFFREIVTVLVVATGCYMVWENLRELWT